MRFAAGDKSLMADLEKNFNSNDTLQQMCRNELDLQKISTDKHTLTNFDIQEQQVKLRKLHADADKAEAQARKAENEAKAVLIKAEADANKTNADAEKIRFQTKNIYSEERRKQLSYIQTVDNKAKISGPEQQLWKDVAAEAKNNLHNFVTQQPADGENPAETD